MADITITIQAASDATMTENNNFSGAALGESDARKVYGLPNISSEGLTGYFPTETSTRGPDSLVKHVAKIVWHEKGPRWDTIGALNATGPVLASPGIYGPHEWAYISSLTAGDTGGGTKPNPTTTAFQLRCENISHEFTDNVSISPIPAFDVSPGQHDSAGTPGQLNMLVLALGMRTEIIKLSGVLVDRGLVTASNPRRQILLNIARMQHYKTGRGGQGSGKLDKWGGADSGVFNPRSYPCLRIYESHLPSGYTFGKEPSGDSRQYRGIIKDFSFRLEGGRPDHWFWNMTFAVIQNEHSPTLMGQAPWISQISRVRLVDDNDGDGDEVDTEEDGYFEIRCSQDLIIKDADDVVTNTMVDGHFVYMSNMDSVPTLNGEWEVTGVNLGDRTFIIKKPLSNNYGEQTVIMPLPGDSPPGTNTGTADQLQWNEANFITGNRGHVAWGMDPAGVTGEIKTRANMPE